MMRRTILLMATMALTLLVASGVALAVTRIGTDGPDTLRGTKGNDDVIGSINKPADVDVIVCGSGFDRVLVDRIDVVAPDCEKVFVGFGSVEEFEESIPQSFFEGLP